MPQKYPPYQTCHRRLQQWVRSGALAKALRRLAQRLQTEGLWNLQEAFIDAMFAAAKKGASGWVLPSEARGPRSRLSPWATVYRSPSVCKLLRPTNRNSSRRSWATFLDELPARLIGDRAYDSDPLDQHLWKHYGVELIAPHRSTRVHPTQGGRRLRRSRRRWTVERLFAWLQVFHRLVTRYEYRIENFQGMVRLGCLKIMLRYF